MGWMVPWLIFFFQLNYFNWLMFDGLMMDCMQISIAMSNILALELWDLRKGSQGARRFGRWGCWALSSDFQAPEALAKLIQRKPKHSNAFKNFQDEWRDLRVGGCWWLEFGPFWAPWAAGMATSKPVVRQVDMEASWSCSWLMVSRL